VTTPEPRAPDPIDPLTPEDEARLARLVRRIEDDLVRAVLRRVARTLAIGALVAVGVVVLLGWLSWSALSRLLVQDAVATLQTDDSLRSDVLAGLGIDTTGYARMLELLGDTRTQGGLGVPDGAMTDAQIAELQRMLEALLGEPSTTPARPVPRR
jgi:hypothetical protein